MRSGRPCAIRRGDVAAHRRWMIRTSALPYAAITLRPWPAVLIPTQVALAGVPEQVAFQRAHLLVAFLTRVPDLLVAERYLAVSGRFPAARQGTLSP